MLLKIRAGLGNFLLCSGPTLSLGGQTGTNILCRGGDLSGGGASGGGEAFAIANRRGEEV